ncbi:hypothetical protein MBOT_05820 [Mycobacterium botniense]|uniref:Uncharacterized protein n=1 Tax=Mycobacterium botniense TaxID=84962 RepID=A0A7I9XV18_9MYCO|nr:hypothetical protein MBOT_05820 [Mycobacterium botniense]
MAHCWLIAASLNEAEFPDLARAGAASLDAFENGQRASQTNATSLVLTLREP